jgi:hypothetical protein
MLVILRVLLFIGAAAAADLYWLRENRVEQVDPLTGAALTSAKIAWPGGRDAVAVVGRHLTDPADPMHSHSTSPVLSVTLADGAVRTLCEFPGGGNFNGTGEAPGPVTGAFDSSRGLWSLVGVTSRDYRAVGVALTSLDLADGSHAEARLPTLTSYLGYAKNEDAYYTVGECTAVTGGTAPPECKGHEGNWTLLLTPAVDGGVGTPRVVRVYDQPFVPNIGPPAGSTASSGALDVEGGRLTFFSAQGTAFPPIAVMATISLPDGALLGAASLGSMAQTAPVALARYLARDSSSSSLFSALPLCRHLHRFSC